MKPTFPRVPKRAAGAETEPEWLSGTVDRVIYHSAENGYTVCVLRTRERGDVVVVGTCAAIWQGQDLKAQGQWGRHPEHGVQFTAERILCVEPYSEEGIRRFLASGVIQGIGPMLADRLVKKFGTRTLQIIEKESARLLDVEGIGPKRREQIKRAWNEQKSVQEIMVFLHGHEVSASQTTRIYRQYGDDAVALIKSNPYRLASDIWGIGFKTADRIASSLGIAPDSPVRARAGVVHALQTIGEDGHCCCPREELVRVAAELLGVDAPKIEAAVDAELEQKSLIAEGPDVYLTPLYYAEVGVAQRLRDLLRGTVTLGIDDPGKAVRWAGRQMKIEFAERQAEALRMALTERFSIITGGPGVGKTTIVRALVDIVAAKRRVVCLAAPTGRAAKRLEEATHRPASTIHRLLKYQPSGGGFVHGPGAPLAGDVFVLDEVSMVDIVLMNAFLRALPKRAWVVLVGDADQLPSVGPGHVLRDLLESGVVPSVKLDTVFRQGERSWIVHNAHRVNHGQFFELPEDSGLSDFYFVETNDPEEAIRRTVHIVSERIPKRFGLDARRDVQVLTPMRRFQLGAENLNVVLQQALNPGEGGLQRFGRTFRVGDRVMQLRNNYDKEVFNGDIGFVRAVNEELQQVMLDFDGRAVGYKFRELDELSLAYASSIHKAQGNEHPAVVVLMTMQHYRLLQRNLLYTALTRGRRLVCVVGSRKAIAIAIRNNEAVRRRTGLRARLREAVSPAGPDGAGRPP